MTDGPVRDKARVIGHAGLRVHLLGPVTPVAIVVLIHGIPSVAPRDPGDEGYEGFARHLTAGSYEVTWADLRAARETPGFFSIEGWVEDATQLVDLAHLRHPTLPVVLVGSSAGGAVGLEVAARGAAIAGVACLGTPAQWGDFATDGTEGIRRIEEQADMRVAPEHHADPASWAAEFDEVTAERAAMRCRVPVLILHGSNDDVVPVSHAGRFRQARAAEVRIIEGAGHQLRRDERAVKILGDWLRRVTR